MSFISLGTWKDTFKTQLEARPNLAGVTVYDAEQAIPDTDREAIILGDFTFTVDRLTFDGGGSGVWVMNGDVEARIRIWKPDTAKTARDRAVALLEEVMAAIDADPDTGGTVFNVPGVSGNAEEEIWGDGGRVCTLEFTITVEAHQ